MLTSKSPSTPVAPVSVVAPETASVPAIAVLPLLEATVNVSPSSLSFTETSPETSSVLSSVTASSNFSVPFTVVKTPVDPISNVPPPALILVIPTKVASTSSLLPVLVILSPPVI